jgi:predicted DNA-binding ribbon-helix-helix protein
MPVGRPKAERVFDAAQDARLAVTSTSTGSDREKAMKSPVTKRSILIAGHKTSVSLEEAFWKGLKEIAFARSLTLSGLVAAIDSQRQHGNLSSAIRLFVLDHYRARDNGADGEKPERHGPLAMRSAQVSGLRAD